MHSATAFRAAIATMGMIPPNVIEAGKLYRFPGLGKRKGNTAGWCRLFQDGRGGVFGDFASGFSETWFSKSDKPLSESECKALQMQAADARRSAESERELKRIHARRLWSSVDREDRAVAAHPYALRKQIRHAYGAGVTRATGTLIGRDVEVLLLPLRIDGVGAVSAVQAINADGVKQTFGPMDSTFLFLGNEHDKEARWLVVEGWATGFAYSHTWSRTNICVAFGKARLERIAKRAAEIYRPQEIIILGEEDD